MKNLSLHSDLKRVTPVMSFIPDIFKKKYSNMLKELASSQSACFWGFFQVNKNMHLFLKSRVVLENSMFNFWYQQ